MCYVLIIVSALIPLTLSQNSCVDVHPIANFNVSAFGYGKWYEIARYDDDFEHGEDCTILNFNNTKDEIDFRLRSIMNNSTREIDGYVDKEAIGDGYLYSHSKGFGSKEGTVMRGTILDIDYNSYSVVYYCENEKDKKSKNEIAWIISRTPTLSDKAKKAIENVLRKFNIIDSKKMLWEHFTKEACEGIAIAVGFVPLALSQSACSYVQPMSNFNISAFGFGKWYEIARYDDDIERGEDCTILNFTPTGTDILFRLHSVLNNHSRAYDGFIEKIKIGDGYLYTYSKEIASDVVKSTILDTDYNSYFVSYHCHYDKENNVKYEMAWILSRTKNLDETATKAIEDILRKYKIIDKKKLIWEHFTSDACQGNE